MELSGFTYERVLAYLYKSCNFSRSRFKKMINTATIRREHFLKCLEYMRANKGIECGLGYQRSDGKVVIDPYQHKPSKFLISNDRSKLIIVAKLKENKIEIAPKQGTVAPLWNDILL